MNETAGNITFNQLKQDAEKALLSGSSLYYRFFIMWTLNIVHG